MSYEDSFQSKSQKTPQRSHNIAMQDRKQLSVSGVEDVESFDEREIVMRTTGGSLVICGEDLSISRLSVDSGDVNVQGLITLLRYEDAAPEGHGLWAKLFH